MASPGGPMRFEISLDGDGHEGRILRDLETVLRDDRPLLRLTMYPRRMRALGDDPAVLHRFLADLEYVPELRDETPDVEHWLYQHPDGTLP